MSRNIHREIDKTHLSVDSAEERKFIHRDYIAHSLRWSHALKVLLQLKTKLKGRRIRVLDIGCGKDVPFGKLIHSNRMGNYVEYHGVDVNKKFKSEQLDKAKWDQVYLYPGTNFLDDNTPFIDTQTYDLITCFEVLEHVMPAAARQMATKAAKLLDPEGIALFSTPCWNGKAAANHINEITYEATGTLLEMAGFWITSHYGTFASQRDYVKYLSAAERAMFDGLKEYYDSNLLAIIFAPLYPQYSRNVLWKARKAKWGEEVKFPYPNELETPWTSSHKWEELFHSAPE